ncbi:hypothetical protein LPB248_13540 [Flavobacterium sp. LPB0248]|uniref:BACON domain-containing protein n=1 Tax=Flavobacterium sp. LPB0248 TaxID=2614441 RepID=UPI0015A64EB1|nr:BACON domain-containing carbohydrate-binding protein [Flavobacterium sp. LPB0248]QLC67287.1 hypothetical protein LPB248_13540 [Flavobacterium sp. LPB0248]
MKKKLLMILFGIFSVLFVACSNDEVKDLPTGPSGDMIKLSKKEASFTAEANTVIITTEYKTWWVNGFALDKVRIDKGAVNLYAENFIFKNDVFEVEKKNGNTLIITMTKNTTGAERFLYIVLQSGNYFESISVTQSK